MPRSHRLRNDITLKNCECSPRLGEGYLLNRTIEGLYRLSATELKHVDTISKKIRGEIGKHGNLFKAGLGSSANSSQNEIKTEPPQTESEIGICFSSWRSGRTEGLASLVQTPTYLPD